ncbi:DNA gyrase inhibitor YacG [Candidatus Endoriftia persephonae]|uniref:DNA gyrase inhibitor YacG n=1 Tax=Candidatus Endoriftia persephonae TaxID=393765 RepID=A0A9J6ZWJ4_9GAMM|nr:DNA gyrase inhibitor YacG [Candidatus Endoriftia persephone]USF87121.1 DNA gyrase inhibitor YacG [Candidatus Endoriftia persephone]
MSATEKRTVKCPTCGLPVTWEASSRWRPFCSERCRLIDLGEWFDEEHRIPMPTDVVPDGFDPER